VVVSRLSLVSLHSSHYIGSILHPKLPEVYGFSLLPSGIMVKDNISARVVISPSRVPGIHLDYDVTLQTSLPSHFVAPTQHIWGSCSSF
jgi:hypothetical protein